MSLLLAIALQVGPFPGLSDRPVSPVPPEMQEQRRKRAAIAPAVIEPPAPVAMDHSAQLQDCLALAVSDPPSAIDAAEAWRDLVKGVQLSQAERCRGTALANLARWDEAETAFLAARDAALPDDHAARGRLGAMAGNAALAAGSWERALGQLDTAREDALAASDKALAGEVQLDRARALVALKREGDAAMALDEARSALPQSAEACLLSATLARRMGNLADAQAQIEKAAALLPVDPEIGLEAGLIAVLAGRDDAARKSWQSVITAAPNSSAAETAKGYLAQLGTDDSKTP